MIHILVFCKEMCLWPPRSYLQWSNTKKHGHLKDGGVSVSDDTTHVGHQHSSHTLGHMSDTLFFVSIISK